MTYFSIADDLPTGIANLANASLRIAVLAESEAERLQVLARARVDLARLEAAAAAHPEFDLSLTIETLRERVTRFEVPYSLN